VKFLLDTNTVSFAIRGIGQVGDRLLATAPSDVAISAVTEAELWYGVQKRGAPRLRRAVEAILSEMVVLPVTSEVARAYGELRVWLEKRGRPIGLADTFIAAHARSQSLKLVTNNTRHFHRVPDLQVEDWSL
jgi:tRNA(fMet)-specific endonuclease VapC